MLRGLTSPRALQRRARRSANQIPAGTYYAPILRCADTAAEDSFTARAVDHGGVPCRWPAPSPASGGGVG